MADETSLEIAKGMVKGLVGVLVEEMAKVTAEGMAKSMGVGIFWHAPTEFC